MNKTKAGHRSQTILFRLFETPTPLRLKKKKTRKKKKGTDKKNQF